MPKMNERDRLAKLEADQLHLAQEAARVRKAVRAGYGTLLADLPVEVLTEREFRDIIAHATRVGAAAAGAALAAVPSPSPAANAPERRPGDEHGGAARRRPAP